ncbi:MAG: alpha/beta hydrolase [Ignavibacteriae bacterium]|nr:MAG: alpha/beta hydrolase [Ignavibacteriota bacterium]
MKGYNINGINVREFGEGNKKSIIFVHAFPTCNRMWDPQVEALEKEYNVITYDLRGFGYSDMDYNLTMDSHVDDLFSILESSELDKPVICGLSMGGYITLRALERGQDKFKAVVLCDTRSEADANENKIKRAAQIAQIKGGGLNDFISTFIKGTMSESTLNGDEAKKNISGFLKEIISWQKPEGICTALMTLASRTDTTAFLEQLNIPTLIMVGEDDKLTPPELSKAMHSKIKDSQLKLISGAGHFTNLENRVEFNENLVNFLKGLNH